MTPTPPSEKLRFPTSTYWTSVYSFILKRGGLLNFKILWAPLIYFKAEEQGLEE